MSLFVPNIVAVTTFKTEHQNWNKKRKRNNKTDRCRERKYKNKKP